MVGGLVTTRRFGTYDTVQSVHIHVGPYVPLNSTSSLGSVMITDKCNQM